MTRAALALLLAVALAACAGHPPAPRTTDASAAAFTSVPGRAVVYVFRDERFGAGRPLAVSLNDDDVATLPADAFQRWVVAPGGQTLRMPDERCKPLRLTLAAGEQAFVRASVAVTDAGVGGRLTRVEADEGLEALRETRMLVRR